MLIFNMYQIEFHIIFSISVPVNLLQVLIIIVLMFYDINLTFRIRNKTTTTVVDGASNYKKSFEMFGAEQIGGTNPITVQEIQREFKKHKKEEEYLEIEQSLRASFENGRTDDNEHLISTLAKEREFAMTSLDEIWEDSDLTLPKRIRCGTHNLNLTGKPDFKGKRQQPFWNANPHGEYKSKCEIVGIFCFF